MENEIGRPLICAKSMKMKAPATKIDALKTDNKKFSIWKPTLW